MHWVVVLLPRRGPSLEVQTGFRLVEIASSRQSKGFLGSVLGRRLAFALATSSSPAQLSVAGCEVDFDLRPYHCTLVLERARKPFFLLIDLRSDEITR